MEYRKVALVLGNSYYEKNQSLKNPVHDAEDMTKALESIGFTVVTGIDLSCNDMYSRIDNFVNKIRPLDMVVFHFSGHGTQWEDQNFLIPSDDGNLRTGNIRRCAVNAQEVLDKIGARDPFVSLIFLDCCRNYYLRSEGLRDVEEPRGLKPMSISTRGGSVIGLACDPGKTASDGTGRNGLYTKHLLLNITKSHEEIQDLLIDVTDGVERESRGGQRPWQNISLRRRNIFLYGGSGSSPTGNGTVRQEDQFYHGDGAHQIWLYPEGQKLNCTEWDTHDLGVFGCQNCHQTGANDDIQVYQCSGHPENNFPKTRGLGPLTQKDDEGKLYHGNENHRLWLYPASMDLVNDVWDTHDIERHCDHCDKMEEGEEVTEYRCLGH